MINLKSIGIFVLIIAAAMVPVNAHGVHVTR